MIVSVLWSSGNEGGSEMSQPSRVYWKQHGCCRQASWVETPVLLLVTCVYGRPVASPSFSSLICNKMRVTDILS